jgi:GNAT superfamily N-acetyltransferase
MSSIEVRPFQRADREQLASLVNAHAAAVVPGASASVNAVMNQLEREPGEFVVDPWVVERVTLVAEQRGRIVAAAHLLRYSDSDHVSDAYRNTGEIRWFVSWPAAPYWRDAPEAGEALAAACLATLERWSVARHYADGSLPVRGVYGVPEQWPHVRALYDQAGFSPGRTEIVWLANVDELPSVGEAPVAGLVQRRSVGINGTRFAAEVGATHVGYIEIDTAIGEPGRLPRVGGWADVGNLEVEEAHRRCGIGTWLIANAAEWLRVARIDRLLDYSTPDDLARGAFLTAVGFRELTRTERGWVRTPAGRAPSAA